MRVVLTMAGKYARFKLFGSKIPKYLLPLSTGTILDQVIQTLKNCNQNIDFYLIANQNDSIFYPIVESIMRKHEISDQNLMYISDTASQLETALSASELIKRDEINLPLAFSNIDTIVLERHRFFERLEAMSPESALIDTFNGQNSQYSYARIDEEFRVADVIDGRVISDYACSGLYGFGSFDYMRLKAIELLQNNGQSNFTDLHGYLIESGCEVTIEHSKLKRGTIVLGTPQEYLTNMHRFS